MLGRRRPPARSEADRPRGRTSSRRCPAATRPFRTAPAGDHPRQRRVRGRAAPFCLYGGSSPASPLLRPSHRASEPPRTARSEHGPRGHARRPASTSPPPPVTMPPRGLAAANGGVSCRQVAPGGGRTQTRRRTRGGRPAGRYEHRPGEGHRANHRSDGGRGIPPTAHGASWYVHVHPLGVAGIHPDTNVARPGPQRARGRMGHMGHRDRAPRGSGTAPGAGASATGGCGPRKGGRRRGHVWRSSWRFRRHAPNVQRPRQPRSNTEVGEPLVAACHGSGHEIGA